jgi:hypothetical protein
MADHKARFIAWWKASMSEAEAYGRGQSAAIGEPAAPAGRESPDEELEKARKEKQALTDRLHRELQTHARHIAERAARLQEGRATGRRLDEAEAIGKSAKSALAILDVLLGPEDRNPGTRPANGSHRLGQG